MIALELCSGKVFWSTELQASKLSQITVKEVQNRIAGRDTKQCTVGLEIHPNRCSKTNDNDGKSKRVARGCILHLFCWTASISFKN